MTDERRHHSRIVFHTPAMFVSPEESREVSVIDISLKGALIRLQTEAPLSVGASCRLHVPLNEKEDSALISMEARIAHCNGLTAGLLCVAIDLDSVTHLRRLVELNLGDPELLNRELSALIAE